MRLLTRSSRRGFSLLELLVVVSILVLAVLVFATFLGPGSIGPSLERSAKGIRSMVTNVRQNASVRKVHSELVFDYRNDQVIALARRRLVTYAFEGGSWTVGSGNVIATTEGEPQAASSRGLMLRDGQAAEFNSTQDRVVIPWMEHFDVAGDYEGVAASFDYFPRDGGGNTVVSMGAVFTINVVGHRHNAVKLALNCAGVNVVSNTWCSLYRWVTVEIAVSRYGVSLYIDGRLNEGDVPDSFAVASAMGVDCRLGGSICRIDNFELNSLVSSQILQLDSVQLIAPDVKPQLEIEGQAEDIYDWKAEPPKHNGPITGLGKDDPPPSTEYQPGLPFESPPAIVHVYFDAAGKLDPAKHDGAVYIHLISLDNDEITRMTITIHPLGVVTWDYVDLFSWEKPPPNLNDPSSGEPS